VTTHAVDRRRNNGAAGCAGPRAARIV